MRAAGAAAARVMRAAGAAAARVMRVAGVMASAAGASGVGRGARYRGVRRTRRLARAVRFAGVSEGPSISLFRVIVFGRLALAVSARAIRVLELARDPPMQPARQARMKRARAG